jgi:hypothetical protein
MTDEQREAVNLIQEPPSHNLPPEVGRIYEKAKRDNAAWDPFRGVTAKVLEEG